MQRPHFFRYFYGFQAFFLMFISGTSVHPFYISVAEIHTNSTNQSFNVSLRMFTDDLQTALYKLYQYKTDLEKQDVQSETYLHKYIQERFQITVNGQPVTLRFVGYEQEEEATWCHLEVVTYPGNGKVQITNRLLYDFISEQTNLVHFYRDGVRSSTKLQNPEKVAVF
jgi:hypothetical protein